jgi:adenine-specific DNA-methyltransferase
LPITPIDADDPLAASADPVAANVEALRGLFPDAFADGRIDFETLRQLLGSAVDEGDERFGLNWSGKRAARRAALTPSLGTLRPAPEDSVDWDSTRNILIEGDNLEVLKLLQKSYAGKIKLIYIDPPYNTGGDFVYPDDYSDSIGNYLRRTGQVDTNGVRNSSNPESSGRYHTAWLNMMLPRIMLARNLLTDDGVILVSIDDREVANLVALLESVFGSENAVSIFTWETKRAARGVPPRNLLIQNHEFVVAFSREASRVRFGGGERDASDFIDDGRPRGPWRSESMKATGNQDNWFDIVEPGSGRSFRGNWAFSEASVSQMIKDDLIIFPAKPDGVPRQRKYLDSYTNETKSVVTALGWHSTEAATKAVMSLFDDKKVFQFPKPLSLIQYFVDQLTSGNDTVLDFFAGSGTTGHAVTAQNAVDAGARRFILVQLPELLDPEDKAQKVAAAFCDSLDKPRTVFQLTKERLRRATARVKKDHPRAVLDEGFRVYKLATSNLKVWQPGEDLDRDLLDAADNRLPGRTDDDLLVELLLKRGIDLTEPQQTRTIARREVHALGGGVLVVCLADVSVADAEALANGISDWIEQLDPVAPAVVIFRDSGFANDVAKTNVDAILRQRLRDRGGDQPHLLDQVRSV